jgi:phage terminase small subunit
MALSARHERFVAEYLVDLNATQAAIRTGYASANADVTGPRLLRNVAIAAAVAERRTALVEKVGGSVEWIIEQAIRVVEESAPKDRVPALALLAKRHPEFRDGPTVDARSLSVTLPDGTTLEDLRQLRDGLKA